MKALRAHFNSNGKAKVSYTTRAAALASITSPDQNAYQCPDCGQWHIGRGGKPQ